jgi:hypothetical protein
MVYPLAIVFAASALDFTLTRPLFWQNEYYPATYRLKGE